MTLNPSTGPPYPKSKQEKHEGQHDLSFMAHGNSGEDLTGRFIEPVGRKTDLHSLWPKKTSLLYLDPPVGFLGGRFFHTIQNNHR